MPTSGGLQPASVDALFDGKGLPPYQPSGGKGFLCRSASPCRQAGVCNLQALTPCSTAKDFYVGRHSHADKWGLQPARADALFGGKGLPP